MVEVETITPLTDPLLIEILASSRVSLNASFQTALWRYPQLEGAVFLALLRRTLPPITAAMTAAGCTKEEIRPVLLKLYEHFLELLGKGFLGNKQKYPLLEESLLALFTRMPRMLAARPWRLSGAIINGLLHLLEIPNSRPLQWVHVLNRLHSANPNPEDFLLAGQVAAWRCGLAHYRHSALETCRNLSSRLVQIALDLPDTKPIAIPVDTLVNLLLADPWLHPETVATRQPIPPGSLKLLLQETGAFIGFGGVFISPPQVLQVLGPQGGFVLQDAKQCFVLFADLFGFVVWPIEAARIPPSSLKSHTPTFQLSPLGIITMGNNAFPVPALAGCSSFLSSSHSFCAVRPLSHAVIFGGIGVKEADI